MKIIAFLENGVATDKVEARLTELEDGNVIYRSNGSYNGEFEQACDLVFMDRMYKKIYDWAKATEKQVEVFGEKLEPEPKAEAEVEVEAEVEADDAEPTLHEVPEVEVGVYQNEITGEKFLRKKGAMAKAFKESIEQHGWDNFVKLES